MRILKMWLGLLEYRVTGGREAGRRRVFMYLWPLNLCLSSSFVFVSRSHPSAFKLCRVLQGSPCHNLASHGDKDSQKPLNLQLKNIQPHDWLRSSQRDASANQTGYRLLVKEFATHACTGRIFYMWAHRDSQRQRVDRGVGENIPSPSDVTCKAISASSAQEDTASHKLILTLPLRL